MARRDTDTDDDAPWLAPAGTPARTRVSRRSVFWTLFILLGLAAVATVGLILLLSKKDSGSTQGYMNAEQAPLITADPSPYKIPPIDPKGLSVEGQDQTIYAAGEGIDHGSTIDMSALPEQPIPRPGSAEPPPGPPRNLVPDAMTGAASPPVAVAPPRPAAVQPAMAPPPRAIVPASKPAAPAAKPPALPPTQAPTTAKPKPLPEPMAAKPVAPKPPVATTPAAPAASGTTAKKPGIVQLGAFSSEEKANAAWASLAARHGGFAGFSKRLMKVESDGKTLWRLRAGGGDAAVLCAKMKAGGDACSVVE